MPGGGATANPIPPLLVARRRSWRRTEHGSSVERGGGSRGCCRGPVRPWERGQETSPCRLWASTQCWWVAGLGGLVAPPVCRRQASLPCGPPASPHIQGTHMADDNLATQLATACSRSAVPAEAHQRLAALFPASKLIRCVVRSLLVRPPPLRSAHRQPSEPVEARGRPVACQWCGCGVWVGWQAPRAAGRRVATAPRRRRLNPPFRLPLACAVAPVSPRRLSFGLQNKVMVSITVDLGVSGATHASYVPIHPTAAAAAVLQNQPIVVVREAK